MLPRSQVFLEYGFHPRVQRWVISQCLCTDQRSLASYGVRRDSDTAFLYLLTARHSRLTRHLLQQDQESALLLAPPSNPPPSCSHPHPLSLGSSNSGGGPLQDWRTYSTMPPQLCNNGTGATPTHTQPTAGKHLKHAGQRFPEDQGWELLAYGMLFEYILSF